MNCAEAIKTMKSFKGNVFKKITLISLITHLRKKQKEDWEMKKIAKERQTVHKQINMKSICSVSLWIVRWFLFTLSVSTEVSEWRENMGWFLCSGKSNQTSKKKRKKAVDPIQVKTASGIFVFSGELEHLTW